MGISKLLTLSIKRQMGMTKLSLQTNLLWTSHTYFSFFTLNIHRKSIRKQQKMFRGDLVRVMRLASMNFVLFPGRKKKGHHVFFSLEDRMISQKTRLL